MRGYVLVASVFVVVGCGGGGKKGAGKPDPKAAAKKKSAAPVETEADREKKRHAAAVAIVPEGSACLPLALKDQGAPRLELANIAGDATLCAFDTDTSRLLGVVACWKVDVQNVALAYQAPSPLPGHNVDVLLDDHCARGYCLPKEAKVSAKIAHMAWNLDGTKVAVLVGDDLHLFDGSSKNHESSFSVRGDKGLTNDPIAVRFVGDELFVEGGDQGYSAIWVFKTDGTKVGPITAIGGKDAKPLSTYRGSFSVLDKGNVALAEHGMETLTTYEVASGKRSKATRKIGKLPCKPAEIDAFWHDGDKVTDKCKEALTKASSHLVGADGIKGSTNLLVVLRGERLGELGVLDPKTLGEAKKAIKLPWCEKK